MIPIYWLTFHSFYYNYIYIIYYVLFLNHTFLSYKKQFIKFKSELNFGHPHNFAILVCDITEMFINLYNTMHIDEIVESLFQCTVQLPKL